MKPSNEQVTYEEEINPNFIIIIYEWNFQFQIPVWRLEAPATADH